MLRRLTLVATTCLLVGGCAKASSTVAGVAPSSTRTLAGVAPSSTAATTPSGEALPSDLAGCPSPTPIPSGGPFSAIEYIDFVDANGDTYSGGLDAKLSDADRGPLQLRVRCTVSTWSDQYGQGLANQDGNAAFLPAGTGIFAVKGESPLCRLMAKAEDGWHLYGAAENPACEAKAPPIATALPSRPPTAHPSLADCPTLKPGKKGEGVSVDYGDFVQSDGVSFVADYRLKVTADEQGVVQFRVRCPLGLLNDATHLQPPEPRDGDSSYLPAGIEVFAITGFSPRCRLMAHGAEGWTAYTPRPTPTGCPAVPLS